MTVRFKSLLQLGLPILCCLLLSACRQSATSSPAQNATAPAIGAKAVMAGGLDGQTVVPGVYQIQYGTPFNGSQGLCWDLYPFNINAFTGAALIVDPCDANSPNQFFRVNDDMDASGYRTISSTQHEPNYNGLSSTTCISGTGSNCPDMLYFQSAVGFRVRFNDIPNGAGRRYIAFEFPNDPKDAGQFCVDRPSDTIGNTSGIGAYLQAFNCDSQANQVWIMLGPK